MPNNETTEQLDDMSILDEALPDDVHEEKPEKPDKKEVKDVKPDKDETLEVEEEEEEEFKEEEDKTEEELDKERETQYDRPTITAIKKEFPEFFTKFPSLQNAFFREQEFTRLFPTVDDAKEALEDNNALSTLRDSALSGDAAPVIEALSKTETSSIPKFAKSMLLELHKNHNELYGEIMSPIFENAIRSAFSAAKGSGNEELEKAALEMSRFFFGTDEIANGKKTFHKPEKGPDEIDKKRAEFAQERFQTAFKDVKGNIDKSLTQVISNGLDPDNTMTEYIKEKLIGDIITSVGKALESDPSHMAAMESYWKRAQRDGFDRESISKITNAYLARAKHIVPSVRAKLKKKALGDAETTSNNQRKTIQDKLGERRLPGGAPPRNGTPRVNSREIDYNRTSDLDILDGNITTRKH